MPQHKLPASFSLLNGQSLRQAELYYEISGEITPEKEVIWVCHAFTGGATVKEWWPSLFKKNGGYIDLDKHVLICANILGSCYGSTGPLSVNPVSGNIYAKDFPEIHNRDVVNAFIDLRKALNIQHIDLLIGGSLGGQQALEWSIIEPDVIKRQVLAASNLRHSAWGIAINDLQRRIIQLAEKKPEAVEEGLAIARGLAMVSYRCYDDFELRQKGKDANNQFKSISYLNYQGTKFCARFNPYSYYILSKMMDSHDIALGRSGDDELILSNISAETICLGIDSDVLFPIHEQKYLYSKIPNAAFETIISDKGHDAFLLEGNLISSFINKNFNL